MLLLTLAVACEREAMPEVVLAEDTAPCDAGSDEFAAGTMFELSMDECSGFGGGAALAGIVGSDLVIAIRSEDCSGTPESAGRIDVFDETGSRLYSLTGDREDENFAYFRSTGGSDRPLMGVSWEGDEETTSAGGVRVVDAVTGATVADFVDEDETLGSSHAFLDGDSLVIGAYRAAGNRGLLAVYADANRSSTTLADAEAVQLGIYAGDFVGSDVENLGDIDGDGLDDVAFNLAGVALLLSEDLHSPDSMDSAILTGYSTGRQARLAVDGIGDFDGDGLGDYAVTSTVTSLSSEIYLHSGRSEVPFATIYSDEEVSYRTRDLGETIQGIGDADGDGFSAFAYLIDTWTTEGDGEVRVLQGPQCGRVEIDDTTRIDLGGDDSTGDGLDLVANEWGMVVSGVRVDDLESTYVKVLVGGH